MDSRLTLHLNKEVIDQAKKYAREHQVSLSTLVEHYLLKITSSSQESPVSQGSIVDELSGILSLKEMRNEKD
jgi:hypothetical protein